MKSEARPVSRNPSSGAGMSVPPQEDEVDVTDSAEITVPDQVASSGTLDRLVDTARDYARQATAENTNAAYKADWAHFARWCRRRGANPLPSSPELIGLYIANCCMEHDEGGTRPTRNRFQAVRYTPTRKRLWSSTCLHD